MRPKKNQNIILIGYMGSGKSTVGGKAARAFDFRFLDTDVLIEEKEGCSISDIFAEKGEDYFRSLETQTIKELLFAPRGMVIATGGGLPIRKENAEILKELGIVVYLKCTVEMLLERLTGDKMRPLLAEGNLEEKIKTMLAERGPIYESVADVVIETNGKSFYETICCLEKILKEKG